MGADIHAYPELIRYDEENPSKIDYVESLGDFWGLGRNYTLFGVMAGVRDTMVRRVSDPKGLPSPIGWNAEDGNSLWVIADKVYVEKEKSVSLSKAQKWIDSGISQIVDRDKTGQIKRITHPDWHSASWYDLEELFLVRKYFIQETINEYEIDAKERDRYLDILENNTNPRHLFRQNFGILEHYGLNGLIGMFLGIEQTHEELEGCTRLVFWFDN